MNIYRGSTHARFRQRGAPYGADGWRMNWRVFWLEFAAAALFAVGQYVFWILVWATTGARR